MSSSRNATGWAVIGTGMVSRLISADLASIPEARRRAVCSRDAGRGNAFATEHGFETSYDSVARLLADDAVDIVYVATPHGTHADLAVDVMRAGKHVLIEKPMAVSADEAARIAAVAEQTDRFAMEAMWMRFNPAYRAALEIAGSGRIGEVRSVRASFGLPFGTADSTRWSAERVSSTLLDQGIYPVTLALDLFGQPDEVSVAGRVRPDGVDLAEHMTFDYTNGRFAQLGASMIEYLEPTATISGTDGWITLSAPFWSTTTLRIHSGTIEESLRNPETREFDQDGFGYTPMLSAVHDAVASGWNAHPRHPLTDAIDALAVLDRVRRQLTHPAPTALELR